MTQKAFQDDYSEQFSHCYGCGRLNNKGLKIKTYWDGNETVSTYKPESHHVAVPGYVYGGLIASLIDCHCTATAFAAANKEMGIKDGNNGVKRFVTASLHVDYLKPTPLGKELEIRGKVLEIKGKKVVVEAQVSAQDTICAKGNIVAVQIPESMMSDES